MAEQDPEADVDAVLERIRGRVTPSTEEREALASVVEELLERTERAVEGLSVSADVLHVGSTARGTWLPGDNDVDIFVRFPPDIDRQRLEELGLAVGHQVLPDGRAMFAEHPYVTGTEDGFDVDLVPCFAVDSASEIRSAVDRTPFHNAYLEENLNESLCAEIRAFKRFCTAVGVYGSDLRTQGFSGFLIELLVLVYGDASETLTAVAEWSPPIRLDPENRGTAGAFDGPLIVIDPTDPDRNAAAVVSQESVARLQHHARAFLENPRVDSFDRDTVEPITSAEIVDHIDRRSTHPVALRTDVPAIVDDQLYPQLRRSIRGLQRGLRERGFEVVRSTAFAGPLEGGDKPGRTVVLFVELAHGERPAVERHVGPPVHVRQHAESFLDAYDDSASELQYGPFIDGDRYIVERERNVRTVRAFLEEEIHTVALGSDIDTALADGYEILEGEAVADLAETFGEPLRRYFQPHP